MGPTHRYLTFAAVVSALVLAGPGVGRVLAHCDGLDGPVVKAAERALATDNVKLVLIWVQAKDEPEIRAAFADAVAVRKLGTQARQLADRHFFETLVRLHRMGEGAPFTGLQPAGRDLGPAIPASDRAAASGDLSGLEQLVSKAVEHGLRERYGKMMAKQKYDPNDLAAGREYVASYVEFIHYAERLYDAATNDAHGHYEEKGGH